MSIELNTDQIAMIMQQGFPGIGFAISPQYPGDTDYDKLIMADGQVKPTLDQLITRAQDLNLL